MLKTNLIALALQCQCNKPGVAKLAVAVKILGIENHMIMNMRSVDMGRDYKGMVSFGEPHRGFITNPVRFPRGDFSRLERLPDLIRDDVA